MKKKSLEKVFISEADQYLFAQGTHYDIYKKLGAHPSEEDGVSGTYFAVWAPNAASVHVIGSFNGWDEGANPLTKLGPGGIYSTFIPGVGTGELYKFLITTPDGRKLYKADPSAFKGSVADVSMFLRVAVTGRMNSPDLYEVMQILGRETVLARIKAFAS